MFRSVMGHKMPLFVAVLFLSVLIFFGFTIPAQATEQTGWVEVRITVPEGFQDNIIVTFVEQDTYEEYSTRVLAVNDYVSSFQLPLGRYKFDGAFLENNDFRYNTDLTNNAKNFTLSVDDEAAVLLTLETKYNETYSNGAQATPPAEFISTESTEGEPVSDTVPFPEDDQIDASEEIRDFIPDDSIAADEEAEETEETEETKGSLLIDPEADSSLSVGQRLLFSLISTVVFGGIVFLGVYLYRKHLEES